ncbi:hypothetical protein ACXET9_10430 [Brachybacterium sp. DNPG3]
MLRISDARDLLRRLAGLLRRLRASGRGLAVRLRRAVSRLPAASSRAAAALADRRTRLRERSRERLLSANLRLGLALVLALVLGSAATELLAPGLGVRDDRDARLFRGVLLLICVISLHTLVHAGLTGLAMDGQPRARLVAAARLSRVRRTVPLYGMLQGRTGAFGEALQLVFVAGLAIFLLLRRPEELGVLPLLIVTVAAIATAWIGSAMGFAVESLAEDARGDAFDLPGTPGPERDFSDYLSAAVVVQASSGASALAPVSRGARRIVRDQIVLAHVTSTILITLGVSVVLTALG